MQGCSVTESVGEKTKNVCVSDNIPCKFAQMASQIPVHKVVCSESEQSFGAEVSAEKDAGLRSECSGEQRTKRQLKRELKSQMWLERMRDKRQKERENRKLRRQALVKAGVELPKPKFKRKMNSVEASRLRVAIDLSFNHLMTEKDRWKLTKQVQNSYAANRAADRPVQLYLCYFEAKNKELFAQKCTGYAGWDIHFREDCYSTAFEKSDIVYLTSDSDNVLEDLDEEKVYVIGGLIDHNAHKGLCLRLAEEQGIAHARLPISQYLKMSTRKVLAVNHVMEIILSYVAERDWEQALYRAIPKRKGASLISERLNQVDNYNHEISGSDTAVSACAVDEESERLVTHSKALDQTTTENPPGIS